MLLAVCLLGRALATAFTASREGGEAGWKAALLTALSPGLVLAAFVNWDLFAMALAAGGMAAWATRGPSLSGVLLGLAVATEFYPLLLLGALFILCLRAGKLREFGRTSPGALAAWLVVNLPVALTATSGWAEFYAFSRSRGADWGSVWFLFEHYNVPFLGDPVLGRLNLMSTVAFVIAALAIAVLALAAPRRPRLPQLCFLVLAAFLILNKVWSPQYVIWLVPLAVLSRPRTWCYVLWQLAEVAYFLGISSYFVFLYRSPGDGGYAGISTNWYFVILAVRLLSVAVLWSSTVCGHPAAGPGPGPGIRVLRRPGGRFPGRSAGQGGPELARAARQAPHWVGGQLSARPAAAARRCRRPRPARGSRRPPGRPRRGPRPAAPGVDRPRREVGVTVRARVELVA